MIQATNKTDLILKLAFYFLLSFTVAIFLYGIHILLVPIVISLLNYYLFSGIIDYFESMGIKRVYSILGIFLLVSAGIFFFFYIMIPPLVTQLQPLLTEWTSSGDENKYKFLNLKVDIKFNLRGIDLNELINPEEVIQNGFIYAKDTVKGLISFIPTLVTYALITPVITFILLLNLDQFKKNMIELVPNRFFEMFLMVSYQIDKQITNYLKSLVIQAMIMGSIVTSGFLISGFTYPFLLGMTVGLANTIPYLGPLIGAIPPVLICLLNPAYSSYLPVVISVILFAQLVDNILVQPAFIAKSVSLNPIILIGGVVVAGTLFGIPGMLFAVPVMSILKVTLNILYKSLREYKIL